MSDAPTPPHGLHGAHGPLPAGHDDDGPDSDAPDILLSDPDLSGLELEQVLGALRASRLSQGPLVQQFESAFAARLGRRHAVATSSGTLGAWLALRALGIGPGDEVIASTHAWHQVAHAIALAGATPVFADIDYWSGCLDARAAAQHVGPRTRAILAGNTNGHPADWPALRELATAHGLALVEDSSEAIGSRLYGRPVGSFGDLSVFDFSQPGALCCGEGGMVLTDDDRLAAALRQGRLHGLRDRRSVSIGQHVPLQAPLSELAAALGLAQLQRLDDLLARRKQVEVAYAREMQSFEGIKPPYIGDGVDEIHWMVYVVHLGKRFTRSARNQIVDDLLTHGIEAAPYSQPLHEQYHYRRLGHRRGHLPQAERIADRALALPFHAHLGADEVRFVVQSLKEASVNIGAGVPIY
ncbi:MAG: DegT/DnrJ/EryC1/StrS family aminotransferase [Burkholderiales bacterium]|nr:DegT/DnrJ/EryC1/StrS family aminotransferase [Burkholderiales bacterium]